MYMYFAAILLVAWNSQLFAGRMMLSTVQINHHKIVYLLKKTTTNKQINKLCYSLDSDFPLDSVIHSLTNCALILSLVASFVVVESPACLRPVKINVYFVFQGGSGS